MSLVAMKSKALHPVKLASLVIVLGHSCLLHQSTASEQCSTRQPLSPFYGVQIQSRGGLNPLIESAHSTDKVVIGELPYQAIRNEISRV